jgi:hypothetical protein
MSNKYENTTEEELGNMAVAASADNGEWRLETSAAAELKGAEITKERHHPVGVACRQGLCFLDEEFLPNNMSSS